MVQIKRQHKQISEYILKHKTGNKKYSNEELQILLKKYNFLRMGIYKKYFDQYNNSIIFSDKWLDSIIFLQLYIDYEFFLMTYSSYELYDSKQYVTYNTIKNIRNNNMSIFGDKGRIYRNELSNVNIEELINETKKLIEKIYDKFMEIYDELGDINESLSKLFTENTHIIDYYADCTGTFSSNYLLSEETENNSEYPKYGSCITITIICVYILTKFRNTNYGLTIQLSKNNEHNYHENWFNTQKLDIFSSYGVSHWSINVDGKIYHDAIINTNNKHVITYETIYPIIDNQLFIKLLIYPIIDSYIEYVKKNKLYGYIYEYSTNLITEIINNFKKKEIIYNYVCKILIKCDTKYIFLISQNYTLPIVH